MALFEGHGRRQEGGALSGPSDQALDVADTSTPDLARLVHEAAVELRRLHNRGLCSADLDYKLLIRLELAVLAEGWPT